MPKEGDVETITLDQLFNEVKMAMTGNLSTTTIPTSELEALRADKARLDWWIKDLEIDGIGESGDLREVACGLACEASEEPSEDDLDRAYLKAVRAAIDAAMQSEAQEEKR